MKTGYFYHLKEYESAGYVPVSIARYSPPFYHGLEYKKLAPPYDLLNDYKYGPHKGDVNHFQIEYLGILAGFDAKQIIKDLEELTGVKEDKIILLCFEKPADFCHRKLVAAMLKVYGGIECEELKV